MNIPLTIGLVLVLLSGALFSYQKFTTPVTAPENIAVEQGSSTPAPSASPNPASATSTPKKSALAPVATSKPASASPSKTIPQPVSQSATGTYPLPTVIVLPKQPKPANWTPDFPQSTDTKVTVYSSTDVSTWKSYKNSKNHYTFKYPSDWILSGGESTDSGNFTDWTGKYKLVEFYGQLYNPESTYENTFEKAIDFDIGTVLFGFTGKERLAMRKIIDDGRTLGYFSQWTITVSPGLIAPYLHTRLDFDDQARQTKIDWVGAHRLMVTIKNVHIYPDDTILKLMGDTFHFYGDPNEVVPVIPQ